MVHNIHHMIQIAKLKEFNTAPYFTVDTMKTLFALKEQSFYSNLKRWLKKGDIVRLKKGVYTTSDYIKNIGSVGLESYSEFIANALMPESYLSAEYVLQKYSILSESVFAYTSTTVKGSQEFDNRLGRFSYRNTSKTLFCGFTVERVNGFSIAKATKMKALFDFLYTKFYKTKEVSKELLLSYRLNLDAIPNSDFLEFASYCNKAGAKKYVQLPKILKELKNDN